MNPSLEDKLEQLNDIMTHVGFVVQAGHKLVKELFILGEDDDALQLLERILVHDTSKSYKDEFYGMSQYSKAVESLKDPNISKVNDGKMVAIKLHWERNDHHPEYWTNDELPNNLTADDPLEVDDMPKYAIMEMCCDWYSRSLQFGTNVMDFYNIRAKKRWNFTLNQQKMIEKYLELLQK